MKFIAVVLFLFFSSATCAKTSKKIRDETNTLNKKLTGKSKPTPPAIIAIQIVDPDEKENQTSKNSKRTIDSSLGYGYQAPPRYQVYKYSQQDIPPYRGHGQVFGGKKTNGYNIQKSVSYNIPQQNLNQYYQPGTTLYSTINNGQVGGLTSNVPQSYNEPQVPVIILRVYPNQLNDPGALHANLPQTHPLANVVNNIDIQSLLSKHVQNSQQQQQQYQSYYQTPMQDYQYQQPAQDYQYQQQAPEYQYQQPAQEYQYQSQAYYQQQQQPQYQSYQPPQELLTHENYPKDTHTRVIFHKNKPVTEAPETKTIQITVPDGAYSAVQVETPEMQYGYTSPADDNQQYYYQQQNVQQQNYYQPTAVGYEQQIVEPRQQLDNAPAKEEAPFNYHAHQPRSKKTKYSTRYLKNRQDKKLDDVIKLEPIRA